MGGAKIISGARVAENAALQERAARAASGFRSLGIRPGDVVAVYLRNDFPFMEASAAAGLVGAIAAARLAPSERGAACAICWRMGA